MFFYYMIFSYNNSLLRVQLCLDSNCSYFSGLRLMDFCFCFCFWFTCGKCLLAEDPDKADYPIACAQPFNRSSQTVWEWVALKKTTSVSIFLKLKARYWTIITAFSSTFEDQLSFLCLWRAINNFPVCTQLKWLMELESKLLLLIDDKVSLYCR